MFVCSSDDSEGAVAATTVTITIAGQNGVIAEDDTYSTDQETIVTESIVTRDSDPENDSFSVDHGILTALARVRRCPIVALTHLLAIF